MEQHTDFQLVQQFLHEQQNHVHHAHPLSLAPLDTHSYSPLDTSPLSTSCAQSYSPSYSGSPAPSEKERELPLHAPKPVHPTSIVEDGDLVYSHDHPLSPSQQPMEDNQMDSHSSMLSAPIDSATAFTELWKGLSSSGSFAAAMEFPVDAPNHADEFVYQHNKEEHDEFQQILRAQHDQLASESL
ncbi:hypothetical protein BDP27DRAFT_1315197 [Rhodocollybia butyracea]|uniref:Uncharacterized protein n=1 Tax=Rhodocollybia butyracea TaxID=206335 RepID=A0A9P5Q5M8_9AGAR|nr:hypothetical protein BDP27DRAFT_1315197 [Rhodocollybia butyracea]